MKNRRDSNLLLVRHLLLPTLFLTVALLGGVRVAAGSGAFLFVAPPLVALVLAVLLMLLFARGRLIEVTAWLSSEHAPLTNVSHALTLVALFFASAQAFNSVLPECGLFRWMFAFFFLWTLWNNQFAAFDARRLLRSLAALFGTAFVLKHMLLASLYSPEGGWLKRLAGALLEGFTQGTFGAHDSFAPATGYISFFTLALYVLGLVLIPPTPTDEADAPESKAVNVVTQYRQLSPEDRALLREEILRTERGALEDEIHATRID
ncbi:MAG TPA: hypothetical protein VGW12_08990 [Pyrinomonadaceae bacterium]|nr:hypothetical protein [Pyrinomonadaceae bacterium]